MSTPLLHPPAHLSPSMALRLSQQAPLLLQSSAPPSKSSQLLTQLYNAESSDTWTIYQNLFLSCLRTRDDKSAGLCLARLTDRFGETNEHVMGLKGMYDEAVAEDDASLGRILHEYESLLEEDPTNMAIAKRRVALLRSMSRPSQAIAALVDLLETSPTDAEAWSELSDLYFSQGLHQQAIFSLEEVLLITPNAWNIHARMGEIVYASTSATTPANDANLERGLADSMRWFCRSIELCDDFLRGYYGLKLITGRLLSIPSQASKTSSVVRAGSDGLPPPLRADLQKLNLRATAKLTEIVRRASAGEPGWDGYAQAELIAARELLDRDQQQVDR
ncbi:MAG: hypothetical protein M1832_000375 [Thelocarpon impressellum]|nr:MAG: hypothetical protein M1832_000375 [Thelocarpon impressellum]